MFRWGVRRSQPCDEKADGAGRQCHGGDGGAGPAGVRRVPGRTLRSRRFGGQDDRVVHGGNVTTRRDPLPRAVPAASFHGGNLATGDDGVHVVADRIRGALHVAAARDDRAFPAEQYERLEDALVAAGVRHTMATYDAEHGFAVPDNDTYDRDADERHWAAMEELFGEQLASA
ncbi:dienelactone hydrolase family protein [Amycolatopsis rhabdoformis]|uniref:Dienelactone hydrolase family protein n=1 Tax=Amycolatopsis rhabdoformis TaxID=1448059 RepID=A0ABZ1INP0_9PSEU|nr:dienelactone hydrolase family protein [Amycolatopsis rhabdoformis]WSE35271.1 dienelactone hydrolase family protein [Amycolatopsis rhabdoformis]